MNKFEFVTPVTYRIEFETIGAFWFHRTRYYSLRRAINSFFYYLTKYRGKDRVVRIYAYRGDLKLRDITQEIYQIVEQDEKN